MEGSVVELRGICVGALVGGEQRGAAGAVGLGGGELETESEQDEHPKGNAVWLVFGGEHSSVIIGIWSAASEIQAARLGAILRW